MRIEFFGHGSSNLTASRLRGSRSLNDLATQVVGYDESRQCANHLLSSWRSGHRLVAETSWPVWPYTDRHAVRVTYSRDYPGRWLAFRDCRNASKKARAFQLCSLLITKNLSR